MSRDAVVGIDLGTTATKVVAFDPDGRAVARSARAHPLDTSTPERAEQDPDVVLDAALRALGAVVARCEERGVEIAALCWSGAMHSLLAVASDGTPMTPALTWADRRAAPQAARLGADGRAGEIYRRTGIPLAAMSPLAKLLWFRDERPDLVRRAARWMSIKEYVLLRTTGAAVVDRSTASATGLLDIGRLEWDERLLSAIGLSRDRLSEIVEVTHIVEGIDRDVAARVGLRSDIPVVVGGSDGAMSNVGLGATAPGIAGCNIGTSAALRICTSEPRLDPLGRSFSYSISDGLWLTGVAVNNGGAALAWLQRVLDPSTPRPVPQPREGAYDRLLELASQAPAGSDGLLFLPFLMGERAPQGDPHARAVFFGLSARHDRPHLVRAVLEGVALQLVRAAALLTEVAGPIAELRATGGLLRSDCARQIVTDALGRRALFPSEPESACLGAAIVGMAARGMVDSLGAAVSSVEITDSRTPSPEAGAVYERLGVLFERVYDHLRSDFVELADLQAPPGARTRGE